MRSTEDLVLKIDMLGNWWGQRRMEKMIYSLFEPINGLLDGSERQMSSKGLTIKKKRYVKVSRAFCGNGNDLGDFWLLGLFLSQEALEIQILDLVKNNKNRMRWWWLLVLGLTCLAFWWMEGRLGGECVEQKVGSLNIGQSTNNWTKKIDILDY